MDNQIVIHASGEQKRIALIENGELAQFFIESPENRRSVGDIYLAQVHKVMSGIRASFIDLSTPKDGFLHYSDLGEHLEEYLVMLNGRDKIPQKVSNELLEFRKKVADNSIKNMSPKEQTVYEQNIIGNLLKPGQKVMVQVVKEPIGSKGPRVSTDITLAGRFLVLIPFGDYVAVSKRIRSYKERRRLRSLISEMLPNGFGVIVRTVAEGQSDEVLREDLKDLHDKWVGIQEKLKGSKPTTLLHRDLDMTESLVRDLFSKNYSRILIDDPESYKTIKSYISRVAPSMLKNVEQYKGKEHVFDHLNISRDVNSIFSPRVKMPSGGYLIFEQTEAMYVVDVNSGRYAAKKAQEDNSLKTNLESAREIAKQLRLRDIGGIIVVDFIDLQQESNRKKVYDEIKKEFKKDRAKTNILPMSDFGVMQITRQRIRPSVVKSVSKVCPMCGGSGSIVSESTLLSDIEAWVSKFKHNYSYNSVELYVNPFFYSVLCQGLISTRIKWMFKYRMRISIHGDETISLNEYKATLRGSEFDIADTVHQGGSIEEAIKLSEQNLANLESGGRKNTELLDIYKKNGRNGKTRDQQSRGKDQSRSTDERKSTGSSSAADDDSKGSRKRSAPVRISSQSRSSGKIKSKYYKKGSTDEGQNNSDNESQKNQNDDSRQNQNQQQDKSSQQDSSSSSREAGIENKPDALEVAKAYAAKMKKQEGSAAETSDKEDSSTKEEPKASSEAVTSKSDDSDTKSKESESSAEETEKKAKAAKKIKRPARSPRKKAVAKPPKNKSSESDEAKDSDKADDKTTASAESKSADEKADAHSKDDTKAKKTAPKAKAKPAENTKKADTSESKEAEKKEAPAISEAKSKKLQEMDAIKATLKEEQFRKMAEKPAVEKESKSVTTSTVGKNGNGGTSEANTDSKKETPKE
ncbi:MAG: Rne/Rng family ribonuclease [Balneolia bacterium]|nr:Rne/Rng family ribonuclease [Balneolia bacterium]